MSKTELIIKLIGTQDAKQWNETALIEWANIVASIMIAKGLNG